MWIQFSELLLVDAWHTRTHGAIMPKVCTVWQRLSKELVIFSRWIFFKFLNTSRHDEIQRQKLWIEISNRCPIQFYAQNTWAAQWIDLEILFVDRKNQPLKKQGGYIADWLSLIRFCCNCCNTVYVYTQWFETLSCFLHLNSATVKQPCALNANICSQMVR